MLSTVDRAIEETEALIAKQQRIKTGLLQDLLTRGIDEHGNLRAEQTHEFKDSHSAGFRWSGNCGVWANVSAQMPPSATESLCRGRASITGFR